MRPASQALLLAAGSKLHKLSNHIHRVCFQKALSILRTTQERTEGTGEGNSLPVVLPKVLLREASLCFLSQHLDVDKVIYIYLHLSFRGQASTASAAQILGSPAKLIVLVTWVRMSPSGASRRKVLRLMGGPTSAPVWELRTQGEGKAKWKCRGRTVTYGGNRESDNCHKLKEFSFAWLCSLLRQSPLIYYESTLHCAAQFQR